MNKLNTDLTKVLLPKYANKWVAMNSQQTKVVTSNRSPEKVVENVRKKGIDKPVITFVPKDYAGLIP